MDMLIKKSQNCWSTLSPLIWCILLLMNPTKTALNLLFILLVGLFHRLKKYAVVRKAYFLAYKLRTFMSHNQMFNILNKVCNDKETHIAVRNTRIVIHQPFWFASGQATDFEFQARKTMPINKNLTISIGLHWSVF